MKTEYINPVVWLGLILCIVLITGCAIIEGPKIDFSSKIDYSKLSQIQVGVTTRTQVEQLLGKHLYPHRQGDRLLLCYMYDMKITQPLLEKVIGVLFIFPSILLMPSHSETHGESVVIQIASDEKVVEISTTVHDHKDCFGPLIVGAWSMEGGREVTPEEAARIRVNETTRDEVEALLGPPRTKGESLDEFYWDYWYAAGKMEVSFVVYFGRDGKVLRTESFTKRGLLGACTEKK